jgi:hypothetical protein
MIILTFGEWLVENEYTLERGTFEALSLEYEEYVRLECVAKSIEDSAGF